MTSPHFLVHRPRRLRVTREDLHLHAPRQYRSALSQKAPDKVASPGSSFYDHHSEFTGTGCANAEVELLALSTSVAPTTVLIFAELWRQRVVHNWLLGQTRFQGSLHLISTSPARSWLCISTLPKTETTSGHARTCMYDSTGGKGTGSSQSKFEREGRRGGACVYSSDVSPEVGGGKVCTTNPDDRRRNK
ncbi:hypothetical protein B0H14DRAFT_3477404 [Mycena olivaceomarginata]|nr:hypothetical protein B0H14DRAFT_3477404 [Mycena olivaceomarginata]